MGSGLRIDDYPVLETLHPNDDAWFRDNPGTAGRADFERGAVLLNPYSPLSAKEKAAVAQNERFRLYMNDKGYVPKFEVQPDQRERFKGTPYERDEKAMKQTIMARIFSGDPSVRPTKDQVEELRSLLWDEQND